MMQREHPIWWKSLCAVFEECPNSPEREYPWRLLLSKMRGAASSWCRTHPAARLDEDVIVQEAALKFLSHLRTLLFGLCFARDPNRYLLIAVARVAISMCRARRHAVLNAAGLDASDLDALPDDHAAPDSLLDIEALDRMLAQLAPAHRDLLKMRYWDGLTVVAIGQRLSEQRSTVQMRLSRVLAELRDGLPNHEDTQG